MYGRKMIGVKLTIEELLPIKGFPDKVPWWPNRASDRNFFLYLNRGPPKLSVDTNLMVVTPMVTKRQAKVDGRMDGQTHLQSNMTSSAD